MPNTFNSRKLLFNLPIQNRHRKPNTVCNIIKAIRMKYNKLLGLLILLAVVFTFQNCETKQKTWELKGTTSDADQVVYLYQFDAMMQKSLIDSTLAEKGKFKFEHGNASDLLSAYAISFKHSPEEIIEFIIANGDHLKVKVKEEYNSEFSGTPIAETLNNYNSYRNKAGSLLSDLQKELSKPDTDKEVMNSEMVVYNEKMQDLENQKIDFLKSIQNPELNSYLILNEIVSTGVIEKELFGKYANALTPEGAMTNNGHKIRRIYEVIDAYALSREVDILDTATIRKRYDNLDEANKDSEFAKEVKKLID